MKLIDTHCHLCHGRLRSQLDDVLARAREAGVISLVCAAGDLKESQAAAKIASRREDVHYMAGVHPHDAKNVPADYLGQIEEMASRPKNVAIGEIGLDYHYEYSPREDQRRVFAEQLDLARRLGKKIVIHTREAFEDTMSVLAEAGVVGLDVVFHSFTGGPEQARLVLDMGAMISFSGIVTFAKAEDTRKAAKLVPADRLLIETDAPFLSPEPVRKMKTNEPANVAYVAGFLAKLYGISAEQLSEQTTANAVRFFGLQPTHPG